MNPNVQRLAMQPVSVTDVNLVPLPEPPERLMRLPGMAEWVAELKLMRERDRETLQRLILTKISQP